MDSDRITPIYGVPIRCNRLSIERAITEKVLLLALNFLKNERRPFSYERFRTAIEDEMRKNDLTEIEHHLHISEGLLTRLLNENRHLKYEINRRAGKRLRRRDRQQLERDRRTQSLYEDTVLQLLGWRSMLLEAQAAGIESVTDHYVRIP